MTKFNNDKKFDMQLSNALQCEKNLAAIFSGKKIELKSETYQWEKTGNICIEYEWNGKPSGIAATEADFWVHELRREDSSLVYLMFPIKKLRDACRKLYRDGYHRENSGDNGKSKVILFPIDAITEYL